MEYVNADDLIQEGARSPEEQWLDMEMERRGASEQGAEPIEILRRITLELAEKLALGRRA